MKGIAVLLGISLFCGQSFAGLELNKLMDAEIVKCQSALDLKSILAYSLVGEWGNFPEDHLKQKLSTEQFSTFMETAQKVKPYFQHLAKDGRLIDNADNSALTAECEAFGRSALLLGVQKLSPLTSHSDLAQ